MNNRKEIVHEFAKTINSDNIIKIILFGSVARGGDAEESDIDILIVSNDCESIEDFIAEEVVCIRYDKNELISTYIMSEDRFINTQHFSFLSNIFSEGVEIE